jgi:hypothetical protein
MKAVFVLALCLSLLACSGCGNMNLFHPATVVAAPPLSTVDPKVSCGAATLPTSPQPVIQSGFVEYKFFMEITPAPNSGPVTAHEVDCGTYPLAASVFNIAKTTVVFGTLQGGALSTEMELAFPDGTTRTFYESGEAIATPSGPTSALRTTPGILSTTWPPFTLHVPVGTTAHFSFNYAIPDPQHTCNPSCIVVGNSWLMGNN